MKASKPALVIYTFLPRVAPHPVEEKGAHQRWQEGRQYLARLWEVCREQLQMTYPLPRTADKNSEHLPTDFPADFGESDPGFTPLAGVIRIEPQEAEAYRQAMLFGYRDVVGLVVCLAPNKSDDTLKRWQALLQEWEEATGASPLPEGVLDEVYVFEAQMEIPDIQANKQDTTELQVLQENPIRLADISLSVYGFHLWEGARHNGRRVMAMFAPCTEAGEQLATRWLLRYTSERPAPLAECLLHAAKIHYEKRVYWQMRPATASSKRALREAINAVGDLCKQPSTRITPEHLETLLDKQNALAEQRKQLQRLAGRLRSVRNTARIARLNLQAFVEAMYPDRNARPLTPFAHDLTTAQWLENQIESDLLYLEEPLANAHEAQQRAQQYLDYARYLVEQEENDLSLLQTSLLGGAVVALTVVDALNINWLDNYPTLKLPILIFAIALASALPVILMRLNKPYRLFPDYLLGALLGASVGWLGMALLSLWLGTLSPLLIGAVAGVGGLLSIWLLRLLDRWQRGKPMALLRRRKAPPALSEPSRASSEASDAVSGASDAPSEKQ